MMPPPATTSPASRIITILVAAGLALNLALLAALLAAHARLNSDFMAFWSFPRFIAAHKPETLYDATALTAFQQQLYPGFHSFYPYLYPPTLLLPLSWLKFLSFGPAELLWTFLGLAALALSVRALFPARPWAVLAGLLASPAALICAATGETAFFTTALLLAGFACLPRRPVLAGLWFGLLTLKPQLGVLIPFFLLARGDWRAIFTACATALALIALSCVVLPPDLWALWWHTLPAYQSSYFNSVKALNLNIIVTPAANLVILGASEKTAWIVQALCGLAMILLTIWAARRVPVPAGGGHCAYCHLPRPASRLRLRQCRRHRRHGPGAGSRASPAYAGAGRGKLCRAAAATLTALTLVPLRPLADSMPASAACPCTCGTKKRKVWP